MTRKLHILVVEDDEIQEESILPQLRREFPHDQVRAISTEYQFRAEMPELVTDPPDVVVMDVMLRWTDPSPNMPPRDEDVAREGPNRAGFRCKKLLASQARTRNVPVILYTVLERADISHELGPPGSDIYLLKDANTVPLLVDKIRECTNTA
jgi:CheY-like chemotaxis protein